MLLKLILTPIHSTKIRYYMRRFVLVLVPRREVFGVVGVQLAVLNLVCGRPGELRLARASVGANEMR